VTGKETVHGLHRVFMKENLKPHKFKKCSTTAWEIRIMIIINKFDNLCMA
jgi:hypothetical protein